MNESIELSAVQICPDMMMRYPGKMLVIDDSLYIVAGMRQDSMLHVVNLQDYETSMQAPYGPGPFEFFEIMDLYYLPEKQLVGIYERQRNAITYYKKVGDKISFDQYTYFRRDQTGREPTDIYAPLGDGYVRFAINEPYILEQVTKDWHTINAFGTLPEGKINDTDPINLSLTHIFLLESNPTADKLAISCEQSDWLSFYHLTDNGIEEIKRSYNYITPKELVINVGVRYGRSTPETIAGYQDLYTTEQHLYALYYGFPELDKDNPDNTCYILQFDWDGNYQKAYHLQEVISHFAVDEERDCIYATYTAKGEDPVLLRYDMY